MGISSFPRLCKGHALIEMWVSSIMSKLRLCIAWCIDVAQGALTREPLMFCKVLCCKCVE